MPSPIRRLAAAFGVCGVLVTPLQATARESVVARQPTETDPVLIEFEQEPSEPALFALSPKFVARQGDALLQSDDYYLAVEREDLAIAYRLREGLRVGGVFVGGVGALIGGVLLYSAESCDAPCASSRGELARARWLGVSAIAGGVLLALGSLMLDPHPVSATEIRALAEQYNERHGLESTVGEDDATPPAE